MGEDPIDDRITVLEAFYPTIFAVIIGVMVRANWLRSVMRCDVVRVQLLFESLGESSNKYNVHAQEMIRRAGARCFSRLNEDELTDCACSNHRGHPCRHQLAGRSVCFL